jgi:hypothetical protein
MFAVLLLPLLTKTLGYSLPLQGDFKQVNFTQTLDHFNFTDKRAFLQRYWVYEDYFDNKTGPVFLYICGESTCKPPTDRSYPLQVCKEVSCLYYVLEHRYYGSSQPFGDW